MREARETPLPQTWWSPILIGLGLSIAAAWPASRWSIGRVDVLWQPLLFATALGCSAVWARAAGWRVAAGRALLLTAVMLIAAWLPWLHSTSAESAEYPYPRVYGVYLVFYEAGWSALLGWLGWGALAWRDKSWWTDGGWSRALAAAPLLLLARAAQVGQWVVPLSGVAAGILIGWSRPWRRLGRLSADTGWMVVPWGLFVLAVAAIAGSGLRIYHQLGLEQYLLGCDDGNTYYLQALEFAKDPSRLWTRPPFEVNFFTLYPWMMSWWFRLVGPHVPSWLIWQGIAGGLLVIIVYGLGRRLAGPLTGSAAAILVTADHVMLHLMGTFNMEVFFIPALYGALALWTAAGEGPAPRGRALGAGVMLGIATLMRPTSTFLPIVWVALLLLERPKRRWADMAVQGSRLIAGFALPVLALMIRNFYVWGQPWGARQGSLLSWRANYAWGVQGQHPATVGWEAWWKAVAADPASVWQEMIPAWWSQILYLWTHRGFGQMDLIQGLNHHGPYQAALATVLSLAICVGMAVACRRRTRALLGVLSLPAYFTGLALVWYVINSRYRAPFLPALYLLACVGFSQILAMIRARPATRR